MANTTEDARWIQEIEKQKATPLGEPMVPMEGPIEAWLQRYHFLICDYLIDHLSSHELQAWSLAYTAVHEMLAGVWNMRPGSPTELEEREAWSAFDVAYHFECARLIAPFTRNPGFEHSLFRDHYVSFVQFAASRGAMSRTDAQRIRAELQLVLSGAVAGVA